MEIETLGNKSIILRCDYDMYKDLIRDKLKGVYYRNIKGSAGWLIPKTKLRDVEKFVAKHGKKIPGMREKVTHREKTKNVAKWLQESSSESEEETPDLKKTVKGKTVKGKTVKGKTVKGKKSLKAIESSGSSGSSESSESGDDEELERIRQLRLRWEASKKKLKDKKKVDNSSQIREYDLKIRELELRLETLKKKKLDAINYESASESQPSDDSSDSSE